MHYFGNYIYVALTVLTPGLFHTMPLVFDDRGPSSLKPRDSGAAGNVGSQNSCPRLRHSLLRLSKFWFRYFTALVFVPKPAARALFLASVDATPDIFNFFALCSFAAVKCGSEKFLHLRLHPLLLEQAWS